MLVGGVLEKGLDRPGAVATRWTEILVSAEGFDGDDAGAFGVKEQHFNNLISRRIWWECIVCIIVYDMSYVKIANGDEAWCEMVARR